MFVNNKCCHLILGGGGSGGNVACVMECERSGVHGGGDRHRDHEGGSGGGGDVARVAKCAKSGNGGGDGDRGESSCGDGGSDGGVMRMSGGVQEKRRWRR
ncbi:hypothetical protein Acr_00g0033020 [Actinidia rufa]|uniref:Uncharacterized protein n=1 Tax=Actinidia rufa TaxID=165716 RepID=A0A7J0DGQ6_9ERIC|nr:hypothetical protein Acr_00g0033020 [Actinidia rufa]